VLRKIDHVVIVVRDLERAIVGYRDAGFTVNFGGEHVGGLTHNALISFADGSYFELIAFKQPDQPQEHRWYERLQMGEGLVDYALLSDNLDAEAARVEAARLPIRGPSDGGRHRPDGQWIAWRSFVLGNGVGSNALPFVIQDVTPRELRVPGGEATRHRLGVSRVAGLSLVVSNIQAAVAELTTALGTTAQAIDPREESAAARFTVGDQWLELVHPGSIATEAGQRLAAHGEGPYEVVLGTADAAPGVGQLLAGALHGARIRIAG
jgi:catechol 2,3-dioxygenase-like lactoylglutathione lyase family enzyme